MSCRKQNRKSCNEQNRKTKSYFCGLWRAPFPLRDPQYSLTKFSKFRLASLNSKKRHKNSPSPGGLSPPPNEINRLGLPPLLRFANYDCFAIIIRSHSVGRLSPFATPRIGYTPPFSASCDIYRPHRGNASPSACAPRAAVPFAFRSSLCLFRYPTSSGRRCVQFSSLLIANLRRVVRSFPSADPASPFARLCDYRLSPIERPAAFRRTRFMHRKIRRQTHYRLQRKFDRTDKCAFKNL